MKSIIITVIIVGHIVVATSIYFAVTGDSVAQIQAVETISDVISGADKVSETKVVELIESTLTTEPASEPPIPDNIRKKIEATAAESHPDDLSKQLVVIKKQTEADRELEGFNRPDDIPENVFQVVSRNAVESHGDDYASQRSSIKNQLKGYRQLKSFVRPDNVPDTVIRAIARKAVESHRNDFSKQFNLITNELTAYRELQRFDRPADIPENVFRAVVEKAVERSHPADFSTILLEIKNKLTTYRNTITAATR